MRLLIFTDSNTRIPVDLIKSTVRLTRETDDMTVCGIVTSGPSLFRSTRRRTAERVARHALTAATNANVRFRRDLPRRVDVQWLERERIPWLVPPNGNANDPAFLELLRDTVRPDVALSYFCMRIFKPPLLAMFQQTVNFHNGLLPRYKGIQATSFSMYAGDVETGFTFHRMTEDVDAGPILLQDAIPVGTGDDARDVVRKLADAAVASLPAVLERVLANDPGRPQEGTGSYFSGRDAATIRRVDRPEEVTEEEFHRRLRAFRKVSICIDGTHYPVTRLRRAARAGRLSFRTSDGAILRPDRLNDLPAGLHRLRHRVR